MEVLDLTGRNGLAVGIAKAQSLAWAAAQRFHSAGAVQTRAAAGIAHFDGLINESVRAAPLHRACARQRLHHRRAR